MPDDLERLHRKVEEGLAAAQELKRLKAEQQRQRTRGKLRVIKGGGAAGIVWAGVEWLLDPRKLAVGMAAAAVSTGVSGQESPSWEPPRAGTPPAYESVMPDRKPAVKPSPHPARTAPLRTTGRSPLVTTTARKPAISHTEPPPTSPIRTPNSLVAKTPIPTPSPAQTLPPEVETPLPSPSCGVDLLGVKVCLPLG